MGGHNVNMAVIDSLAGILNNETSGNIAGTCNEISLKKGRTSWQVLHISGKPDFQYVLQQYNKMDIDAKVLDFCSNIDQALKIADLVIGRAGASTLAEIAALGKPSILLPYPYHKDQHQWLNADQLANIGAAKIVKDFCDTQKTAVMLQKTLISCMNQEKYSKMLKSASRIENNNAAKLVAEYLMNDKAVL